MPFNTQIIFMIQFINLTFENIYLKTQMLSLNNNSIRSQSSTKNNIHTYKQQANQRSQIYENYLKSSNTNIHVYHDHRSSNKTYDKNNKIQEKISELLSKPIYVPRQSKDKIVSGQAPYLLPYKHVSSVGIPQISNANVTNVNIPPSKSRFVQVPYKRIVYDIQPRQVTQIAYVKVPRQIIDHYTIQYKTQFIPQQRWEKQIQIVPFQKIQYRKQYLLTEKQIILMPDSCIQSHQIKMKQQETKKLKMNSHYVTSQTTRKPSFNYNSADTINKHSKISAAIGEKTSQIFDQF